MLETDRRGVQNPKNGSFSEIRSRKKKDPAMRSTRFDVRSNQQDPSQSLPTDQRPRSPQTLPRRSVVGKTKEKKKDFQKPRSRISHSKLSYQQQTSLSSGFSQTQTIKIKEFFFVPGNSKR